MSMYLLAAAGIAVAALLLAATVQYIRYRLIMISI